MGWPKTRRVYTIEDAEALGADINAQAILEDLPEWLQLDGDSSAVLPTPVETVETVETPVAAPHWLFG